MKSGAPASFGAQLKSLREAAGFTQEELATIAGLSVHAISALERGHRRRPHVETVRALSAALDLTGQIRDAFLVSARAPALATAVDELNGASLPVALTALHGRERDLQTLQHWLAGPDVRFITLIGPGGVGKTRLALELARGVADEGSTRVVFVPLVYVRDPGLAACSIAEALGLADVTSSDLPKRARAACGDQQTLLVLDNFEQILAAAPLLAEIVTSVPVLRLLVTSRAPLRVRGEREYAVGPLALDAGAEAMPPADLARVAAVRLFVERVRDVQPEFCLTAANGPTVTAICRKLDALPLALELAAPWMKVLTAEALLRRLAHDPLMSTVSPRDLPERHQTMNATVAWSYQLLDSHTQRALRRFGALPGRFSIDAAAAVLAADGCSSTAGDGLDAIAALIDKSLLLRAETAVAARPLYRMLETVRAYAARELTASADVDDAMEGLARYCIRQAGLAFDGLVGPAQAEWLNRVHEDLENYRGALTWLIARGRGAEAAEIGWGLMFFWMIRGHLAEGLSWYEATLDLTPLPPAAETRALTGAALMWFSQGEFTRARAALGRTFGHPHGVDAVVLAGAQDIAARVELGFGDLRAAHDFFARAIEGFKALALPWGTGNSLIGMSAIPLETGDDQWADRLLDEATSVLGDSGPWFVARAFLVRAILAVHRRAPDEAIAFVRQSLLHIRELHDKYAFVHAVVPLAAAAALKGDDAWAARILGAGRAVTERTGARTVIKPAHDLRAQVERDVRQRLGPERWARGHAAGRHASIDSLLKDIDATLSSVALA
ncbi:MAG TPA: helix-turn-helix domain-containing protein [Vicinamibacterales bacterium]|nr:helix-turn-helix domain-containing protein [Vicinamibacterales bacterium]